MNKNILIGSAVSMTNILIGSGVSICRNGGRSQLLTAPRTDAKSA